MTLLNKSIWEGRIYSGEWIIGSGQDIAVVEPATGHALGRVGSAGPAEVQKAAERAAQAQRDWAALPYLERAAVLRRAAQLFERHQDEIATWLMRESGRSVRSPPSRHWLVASRSVTRRPPSPRLRTGR